MVLRPFFIGVVLFLSLCCTCDGKKKKKTQPLAIPANLVWDEVADALSQPPSNRKPKSYLFTESDPSDVVSSFIQDIVDVIHAKQNLEKADCSRKRLLILQMTSTSFEGTGSLLKQVMISTAIAMHSNRTLIWGLGLPFIFEHTKEIWNGQHDLSRISVNNETIDCRQEDPSGGPLGCFFEPISTCSLEDTFPAELISFSEHPSNESARLCMSEMSKGISMYHPPHGLFDFIWSKRHYPAVYKAQIMEKQAYIWASAVAAYVFRIKPALLASLTKKFSNLFPEPSTWEKKSMEKPVITWGIHVRHGDLKALSSVYSYKEVFEFEDYFAAGLKLSYSMQQRPDRLFVATDSVDADNIPKIFDGFMVERRKKGMREKVGNDGKIDEEDDESDDDEIYDIDEDDEEDELLETTSRDELDRLDLLRQRDLDTYYTWWQEDSQNSSSISPSIFAIPNAQRYRTPHGSHTVAANGGCLRDEKYQQKGMRCALTYDAIIQYQSMEEHRSQPRSLRLMRVLLESIEDLYLLSRCDALIAQGSSHFSTLAALLIWARTLGNTNDASFSSSSSLYLKRIQFLDNESIRVGFTPTGFLHGMNLLNGTHSVDTSSLSSGAMRWHLHTTHFFSALPMHAASTLAFPMAGIEKEKLSKDWAASPWLSNLSKLPLFHLGDHFPQYEPELFYLETKTWLGFEGSEYIPSLPGHCPGKLSFSSTTQRPLQTVEDIILVFEYIAQAINIGVDHLNVSHTNHAMQCWQNAKDAIAMYPEVFTTKSQKLFKNAGQKKYSDGQVRDWSSLFQRKEELLGVIRDNMGFIRIMRYAEMAINENRNTRDYLRYNEKYMQRAYDGVDRDGNEVMLDQYGNNAPMKNRQKHDNAKSSGSGYSPEGNKLFSLEDVNEEIIRLESELKKMTALRDKLIEAHYMYMNGKIDELKKQGTVRQLPSRP